MEPRKLNRKEHGSTRLLWEQIFHEDTERFLDYYYEVKAAENEIFVMEEGGRTRAMLQLNPYRVWLGGRQVCANYIVGVATDPDYRHQGLMRRLLCGSLQAMYGRREPFTFLMPAAEAIYYPFGFRFIYDQLQGEIHFTESSGKNIRAAEIYEIEAVNRRRRMEAEGYGQPEAWDYRSMEAEDAGLLAEFSEQILRERYEVYTVRDEHYFKVLKEEQNSENGDVILLFKKGVICGWFYYGIEGGVELREVVFSQGAEEVFQHTCHALFGQRFDTGRVLGISPDETFLLEDWNQVPVIMARIVHLEEFLTCFTARESVSLCLEVRDEIIEENNGIFLWEAGKEGSTVTRVPDGKREAELSVDIGELTRILFGYGKDFPEEKGSKKLNCIHFYDKVFLNEIV